MPKDASVICLGEAMGEISFPGRGAATLGVGGDVFNTAVYLARLSVRTSFASRVGTDPFGGMVRQALLENGVSDTLLAETDGATTGLYSISVDENGERSFHYWRESSAARGALAAATGEWLEAVLAADYIYLSEITLYVFEGDAAALLNLLERARDGGSTILFDGNFRPRLWAGREDRARALYSRILRLAKVTFPTFEDEVLLWGDASVEACLERLKNAGAETTVLKRGPLGCLVLDRGSVLEVPVLEPIIPVDTTAAGDSFNAGYIAAWIEGQTPRDSAAAGHELAGKVIRVRGAILPREKF